MAQHRRDTIFHRRRFFRMIAGLVAAGACLTTEIENAEADGQYVIVDGWVLMRADLATWKVGR